MKDDKIFIVFIGTSSGQTSQKRYHSSLLIKSKDFNLLVDCGEGTSKALLHHKISFDSIDGILFSHLHPDHSAGLPSFIVQLKQQKRTKPLKVYCHKNLTAPLKMFLRNSFVFTKRATFSLEYFEFEHDEEIAVSKNFSFISRQNSHLDKYRKYLGDKNGFACSSFLFELGVNEVFYSGDIASVDDLYLFRDENPQVFITEVTHISLTQVVDYYKLFHPKKIYLTHYSDGQKKELKKSIKELQISFHDKIILAEDGISVEL